MFSEGLKTRTAIRHFEAELDRSFESLPLIGLIVLSTDCVTEHELRQMGPADKVSTSSTRIRTENPLTLKILRDHVGEISRAVRLFEPSDSVDVFAYACTSGSAVNSLDSLARGVRDGGSSAPITAPMPAAIAAFQTLGVRRISMLTPYPDEVTQFMCDHLEANRLEVISAGSFSLDIDYEMSNISPRALSEAAAALDVPGAEAIFLPCTALRASSVIAALEVRRCKPVVTAHQAMLWHALRLAKSDLRLSSCGRLFEM